MKSIKKLFLLLIIVGLVSAGFFYFRDTEAPQLTLSPASGPISKKSRVLLALNDEGMGLKTVQITVVQGNDRIPLVTREFPAKTSVADVELDLNALKLKQGAIQIEIAATDHSIYHLGKGNSSLQTYDLVYDTSPPVISILSTAHNFTKGGSGLVTFNVNEDVDNVGVQFGDYFFRLICRIQAFMPACSPTPTTQRKNICSPRRRPGSGWERTPGRDILPGQG